MIITTNPFHVILAVNVYSYERVLSYYFFYKKNLKNDSLVFFVHMVWSRGFRVNAFHKMQSVDALHSMYNLQICNIYLYPHQVVIEFAIFLKPHYL